MQVVLNFGLGVDSATILHRWLTDPTTRDFPLEDLVVVTAQTGDEFEDTKRLVETHLFPLIAKYRVRYVQLARKGPKAEDGILILDDSRAPKTLHIQGGWKLSDELLKAGTVPQVASRKCSIKLKGVPIDSWLASEMKGVAFRQAMGFNADEARRIERDGCYGGDNRHAEYPLMKWGMSRKDCELYLLLTFGEPWRKSCCVFCPFANGKDEILARYRSMPEAAADALVLEHMSMALNPNMTLYRDRSLRSCLESDGNLQAIDAFQERLLEAEWAIYRVRRVYHAKGRADRAVDTPFRGSKQEMSVYLHHLADCLNKPIEESGGSQRFWLVKRAAGYPSKEIMYVAAPAFADNKAKANFEKTWERL